MKTLKEYTLENILTVKQDDLAHIWASQKHDVYKKTAPILARLAVQGEKVVTVIAGEKETENTAHEHDVLIKGVSDEEYLIGVPKFIDRYIGPLLNSKFQKYNSRGTTLALKWIMPKMTFMASWGESMIINPGDMLCSINGKDDFYRIEKNTFAKTYTKI